MSPKNLRILLSELTIVALFFQSTFGIFLQVNAVNPSIHELIPTHSVQSTTSFVMSGTTYVAIANGSSGNSSKIIIPSSTGASSDFQVFPSDEMTQAFEYFSIGGSSYLAQANGNTGSVIYVYSGSQFVPFQYLSPSLHAVDFTAIRINSQIPYLAAIDGSWSWASLILGWTGTWFTEVQSLSTNSATAIEHFSIVSWERELGPYAQLLADNDVIANQSNISDYRVWDVMTRAELAKLVANLWWFLPTSCHGYYLDVNSDNENCGYIEAIADAGIIPNGSYFYPYDSIPRAVAVTWVLAAIGDTWGTSYDAWYLDLYDTLGDSNYYSVFNAQINRLSEIGCAPTGQYFRPNEAIIRGDAFKIAGCVAYTAPTIQPPSSEEGDYIALFDYVGWPGHSGIYKWDGSQFIFSQSLDSNGPASAKAFTIGVDQYLATLDHGSSIVRVYKWHNSSLTLFQTFHLNTSGGSTMKIDTIDYKWITYLVTPNLYGNKSTIYAFVGWQFEPVQHIETGLWASDLHKAWDFFTLSGEPYLFLANSFNTTDSVIYKWTPLPYVVIKSPISGEWNNYGIWNPGITPITGIGTPWATILVHNGSGAQIGSGTVSVSGEFSIYTTAGKYAPLPIIVTPYNQTTGEQKTIDYINTVQPAPIPTSSHASAVYRDPFTFTISWEPSFYTVSWEDQIHYDIYRGGLLSFNGDVDSRGVSILVSGEDTTIQYYGKDNSWATTPVQERKFYYDVTAPTLNQTVYNSITGMGFDSNSLSSSYPLEIKTATIQTPVSKLYYLGGSEVVRFALKASSEDIRIQNITFDANTSSWLTVEALVNGLTWAYLFEDIWWEAKPSVVSISWNTVALSSMNEVVPAYTTKNYFLVLPISNLEWLYGKTINMGSPIVSAVFDAAGLPAMAIGQASTITYTISTFPPTVQVTSIAENRFNVRVTNMDSNTGMTLSSARFDFSTILPPSTTYTATACLRDLGNTNTCWGYGTSTQTGTVPGVNQTMSFSGLSMSTLASNWGYMEFEVYTSSAYFLPAGSQIQASLTQLDYVAGGLSMNDSYVGVSGASAIFTKDGGGGGGWWGSVSIALDGSLITQYVANNAANVPVGTVQFTAGAWSDVVLQSMTIARSGLGVPTDIMTNRGVRAAASGVIISSDSDYYDANTQNATVYFSPALTIPAWTTKNIDILANLLGSENSQHQFTLSSINAGSASVSGGPVTLGILNTTSYIDPMGNFAPTNTIVTNQNLVYFITGSTASVAISAGDATINFGGSGSDLIWNAIRPTLNNPSYNGSPFGDVGIVTNFYDALYLSGGKSDYSYSLSDLMSNTTYASFSIYRLPDISHSSISHTGGVAYYTFTSDMATPIEYSYTQSGLTHSGTVQAITGSNSITLTGVSLTGSVSGEIMIPQNLTDITIPGEVHHVLKRAASYSFDPYPDTLTITKKLGVTPGSQVTFGPFTLSGFNVPVNASVNLGSLKVNGVSYGTGVAVVKQWDVITIEVTAISTYNTTYSGSLSLGSNLHIPYEIENALAPIMMIGAGWGGGWWGGSSSSAASSISNQWTSSSQLGQIPIGIMLLLNQRLGFTPIGSPTPPPTGNQESVWEGQDVRHTDILQFVLDNHTMITSSNLLETVNTYLFTPIYEQIQTIESQNRQIHTYNTLIRQGWRRANETEDSTLRRQLRALNTQLMNARQDLIFGND
jgi:hypothetical protein